MEVVDLKGKLISIVSAYQIRTYAQDLHELTANADNIDWLVSYLQTDLSTGISDDQVALARRRETFGTNAKEKKQPPGLCHLIWEALKDFTLRILLVAAILSIVLETSTAEPEHRSIAWIEGFAILVAVFVCTLVSAINDYQKERQFIQLNSVADSKRMVTALRAGRQLDLHEDQLLVGDIINIVQGMQIPTDGILFESNQITTDQSAMTGQPDPILKSTLKVCLKKMKEVDAENGGQKVNDKNQVPSPIMMSGTKVMTGQGKMMVLVVGEDSCLGNLIKMLAQQDQTQTPLQEKLQIVATDIGKFGLYSAIFIVVVLLIRLGIERGTAENEADKWDTGRDIVKILDFIILGITVVVVAIPEGLPLSVTLSLAFSVKKMLDDHNLVRRMQACETMGGANNICSDKTGTLTLNQMTVSQIWSGKHQKIDFYTETVQKCGLFESDNFLQIFKLASLVNSSAELEPPKGSSTEIAFLKFFKRMGINYLEERLSNTIQMKFPFSSSRKRMSIIANYEGQLHIFTKGASQMVLQSCVDWFNPETNSIESINRPQAEEAIHKMASNSLRTLCLAYKKISGHDSFENKDKRGVYEVQKEYFTLIAIVGVKDLPRPGVEQAIRDCHQAGITVRMVTGDNIVTATAIAKQIGLVSKDKNYIAMEGLQFSELVGGVICRNCKVDKCDCATSVDSANRTGRQLRVDTIQFGDKFDEIKDNLLILARSRPQDKYCLVTALKERGNVVAVTGDGTNDAPALKKADVGFAMGISGTEVAREAASITLIDDNFSSIIKAVLWGRNIYDSIRKFIQFQLTVNVVAVIITLVGAGIIQKEILKPIQMLWVNLIMDTLASLALATEQPNPELLKRKPHSRDEYIISKTMFKHIAGQSIYQIIVLLILVFMGQTFLPEYADSNDTVQPYLSHPQYKWRNGIVGGNICSGRFFYINGDIDYETAFDATNNYSRHFTIVFNTFVMLQVFNFLNARKLQEEFNIFTGITKNYFFPVVVFIIFGLQIILVTFPGFAFGVYDRGLSIEQWLICVGFGSGSLLVSVILKLIPIAKPEEHEDRDARVYPSERQNVSNMSLSHVNSFVDSPDKLTKVEIAYKTRNSKMDDTNELVLEPVHFFEEEEEDDA